MGFVKYVLAACLFGAAHCTKELQKMQAKAIKTRVDVSDADCTIIRTAIKKAENNYETAVVREDPIVILMALVPSASKKASFLHVCKRDDPQLTTCMMASVEDLRPYLVEGVPEYNIPSLEPLVMTDFFADEAAGMKIVVSNVSAWGCSDFFVRGLDVNVDTLQFIVDVDIPKLRIEAHYHLDGKLLLVPVKGDGNMETNITDVSARAELQGELSEKDGEHYMTYIDSKLKVHVGGGSVRMANLFNGDKVLLAMINDVVNRNLDVFLKELMPVIEKALASVFKNTGNAIVGSFPFSQLFPQ